MRERARESKRERGTKIEREKGTTGEGPRRCCGGLGRWGGGERLRKGRKTVQKKHKYKMQK